MAKVVIYGVNGQVLYQGTGVRVSPPYNGKIYVWPMGKHYPGQKPIASFPLSQVRTKSKNGQKGIFISKY